MAISTNYPLPVIVNGFSCRNCSEVDQAQKNIDPADPLAGPFGVNDPKKPQTNQFSPEARHRDTLDALHRARNTAQTSPVAAAYAGQAAAPRLVDIAA
ncbi:hypothetical protein [Novosphingobium lentum]|uniref:hypothetical protein n=1 Tax=Novosphingobium lentum TaxID=145287 RepID=UPI000A619AD5|nr:hypothetical protein [Novosphingobium lentum]